MVVESEVGESAADEAEILPEFSRFHVLICVLGFLTMIYATLITLSGMFLNLLPYRAANNSASFDNASSSISGFHSSISQQYRLDRQETGDLTNVLFFSGTIAGSLLGGPASDAIGRVRCALIGQTLLAVFSLASNYAPSFALHLMARCAAGCCLMPAQCAVQVYGCELHSNARRGRFIASWSTGISVGTLAAGLIGWLTRDHQLYVLTSCFTVLPSLLLLGACLPESPVWLAARGRTSEAQVAMRRVRLINDARLKSGQLTTLMRNERKADQMDHENVCSSDVNHEKPTEGAKVSNALATCRRVACLLFRPMSVLGFHGLCLGLNCVGFYFVLSRVIPNVCLYAVVLGVTQLPYAFVLNLLPRRRGLVACGLLSGCACLGFGASARFLPAQTLLLASLGVVGCFFSSAAYSLLVAISAEFFPTELRSTGLGLCIFSLRAGSALAPLVGFLPGGASVQSLALACPLLVSNLAIGLALASKSRSAKRQRSQIQFERPAIASLQEPNGR